MDGATGSFRACEAHCAVLVEDRLGITLVRYPGRGPDWVDVKTGKTYDAVGSGIPEEHFQGQWDTKQIQHRIVDHLAKADYVPVDVSSLTAGQKLRVAEFVASIKNDRVFIVGD